MKLLTHKAIAYNVETNEVIAVYRAGSAEQLDRIVKSLSYDWDNVAITYDADHGLIYSDDVEYVSTATYVIYHAELEAAGYSREDARKLAQKLEAEFPLVNVEIVYDTVGGQSFLGEDRDLGFDIDVAKEKFLTSLEPSAA